jgi:hypothetical protein
VVAQIEAVHVEAGCQLVDGLLQRKNALRMAGRAEGASGAGIDEDVILLDVQ